MRVAMGILGQKRQQQESEVKLKSPIERHCMGKSESEQCDKERYGKGEKRKEEKNVNKLPVEGASVVC